MRSIRIIPIGLLFLLFVANLYIGILASPGHGAVYLTVGLLMISKFRFAELTGFLVPIAIFFIYPIMPDFKNLHPWTSGIMSMFNATIMICCFILLILKIKN
jgi:hypothetical protein